MGVDVRTGHMRNLDQVRCQACNKMLLRIDAEALKPGKALEIKCNKCDALNYRIGRTSS